MSNGLTYDEIDAITNFIEAMEELEQLNKQERTTN